MTATTTAGRAAAECLENPAAAASHAATTAARTATLQHPPRHGSRVAVQPSSLPLLLGADPAPSVSHTSALLLSRTRLRRSLLSLLLVLVCALAPECMDVSPVRCRAHPAPQARKPVCGSQARRRAFSVSLPPPFPRLSHLPSFFFPPPAEEGTACGVYLWP